MVNWIETMLKKAEGELGLPIEAIKILAVLAIVLTIVAIYNMARYALRRKQGSARETTVILNPRDPNPRRETENENNVSQLVRRSWNNISSWLKTLFGRSIGYVGWLIGTCYRPAKANWKFLAASAVFLFAFPGYLTGKGIVGGIMAIAVFIAVVVFVAWALGQKGRWRTVAIVIIALFSLTVLWTIAQPRHATAVKHSAQASINLSAAKTTKSAVDKDIASMRESVYRAKRTIATETRTINRRDSMVATGPCEKQGEEPYIAVVLKNSDGHYIGDSVCVPERDIEPAPALIPPTGSYGIGDYAIPICAGEETGKIIPAGRAKVTAVNGQGFSIWLESGGIVSLAQGESAWVNEPFRIKNGSTSAIASLAITG